MDDINTVPIELVMPSERRVSRRTVDAIRRFEIAKRIIAHQKAIKDEAEAEIRFELGDAELGIHNGLPVVKLCHSVNTSVDQKLLREDYPAAAEATIRITPYTFLKGLL